MGRKDNGQIFQLHCLTWTIQTCLVLSLLLIYCQSSMGQEVTLNPTGRDIQLMSLLKISDTVLGEAEVTITAENKILLPKASTLALLSDVIIEEKVSELRDTGGEAMLSRNDFKQAGLELIFDMSTLECIVKVPREYSRIHRLSLGNDEDHSNYTSASPISGFINLNVAANDNQTISEQDNTSRVYGARIASALNLGWANFEYESRYEKSDDQTGSYLREGTRLNIDFAEQGTRLTVGDMFNIGDSFQNSADILGIGVTRDFISIPTRNVRPRANQIFTLMRGSNVDVVIDGAVVQRLSLGAGTYDLSDIPLAQGTNDIQLVITDSAGAEEIIQFSVATGNDLLDAGEFEYSAMYGIPREFGTDEIDYVSDERVVSGYLNVGVAPWLTLGINGQKREDIYQYGGTVLFANAIGVMELSATKSAHPLLGKGEAYRLALDADFDNNNIWQPQLSAIYEYSSDNFSGIQDGVTDIVQLSTTEHFFSAFGSVYINDTLRAAMTIDHRSGSDKDANYWRFSPGLSGRFFSTPATWSVRVGFQLNETQDNEWNTSLTLSWPFSRSTRAIGRYDSQLNQYAVDTTYQDNIGNTGGLSAYASVVTNKEIDTDVDAGVSYTGNRFEALAGHTTRLEDINDDIRSHNTRVQLSSAVAFAGDKVAIGRPVREAFALVSQHKSLKDNKVAISPAAEQGYARAYGYGAMPALVPDLVAYNPQMLSYEVENLPPGYDLGDGAFWVNPAYRRGYDLQIGSDSVYTVIGTLLDTSSDEPISLVAGVARYLGDESQKEVEFFTNRNGLFAISGVRPGDYELVLENKAQQKTTLTLAEQDDLLIRLGNIYVD